MEDNKRKLYDALSDEFDLGTYEEFERNIGDSVKRQKLYDAASADYDLGDFESYSQKIGPTHRENLESFTAEHGSFLNDFEARDTAETKRMMASARSGAYMPSENAVSGEERQKYMELHRQEEALKKAWFTSDEYLAQKDADALFLSNISKNINKESMEFAQANPVLRQEGAFQINPYATRGAEADTELEKYRTASRIMDDAIKIHNAPSRYDGKNVFLKFGRGAGDILSDADFWTAGLTEIADNFGVRSVLKSVQDKLGNLNDLSEESIENILSPAEKAVLQAWAINAQEQLKRKDDLSRAYQAGQGATESLGFMAEFALTGGVGKLASEGVESMAKWLSKKAMTTVGGMADDVAEKVLRETGEKIAKSTVGKYGTRLAESLAEAAGRTGVMPSTFRNISEKATEINTDEEGNNYLVGMNNAFAKGFADSFIENLSEGGRVNALGELIGDVAGKIPAYRRMVDKFSNTKASELLDAFNSSGIMNTLRAGGWHGLGEEYLEEWYGNALRTLTGVDKEALKEFATVDNQIVTITSFLPMTIFGGTVGTAQVLSASRDLEKKSAALKSALLERGYDEAQADNMIDMMRGSTPAEVSEFLSPIVNSVAGRSVDEAAALMKPVGEFAAAVRRWQAFDTKYKYQEQEQRDNLRTQMEETLGQFWQEDENGRQTVQRGVNASGESVYLLGKPSAEEAEAGVSAEVAAITSDGRKVFVNPSDYELDDELEMNDFLGTEIMAEKGNKEQARMIEERETQNAAIREAAVPGTAINIGTEEAPVQAIVIQRNPDGVIVNTPDGQARQMTLEEFGNYVGINAVPMTDAQIEEQEADVLSAERAQREAALDQEYSNEESTYEEIAEAEDEIEQATEAAEALPLKADGSVDQTALWNNDPERWAQWNDEQRQDGGVNSLAYINGAIAKESARIAEMQAGYDAISDFDERDAVEREVVAVRERLQRLVNLRDGYVAQAEAAQVAAEEVAAEQVAPRITSQMGEQVDEQYDGILRQTRIKEERVRILQEYLDKISEGSLQAFVLTSDNYADVMRREGCSEGVIAVVGMHLEAGENIGGFTSKGKLFLMEDGLPSIEEARITYIHERQHVFNTNNPVFVKAIASMADKQMLLSWLSTFVGQRGLNPYRSLSVEQLADEVVARCMEIAYTTEDFSVDLQSRGIPSEVISIIKDINNEQREDQNLLNSRRGTRRDTYADVSGTGSLREDGRNIEQVSGGVLEQEAARPSGISEEGISPRSAGEGAEVISETSDDEEPSSPFMAAAQQEGESIRFSIATEESLQDKIRKFAKTKDGKETGWTEDDIESIIAETESLIDAIHRSSTGNEFYDEFAYKEPTIRVDWRDGEAKPIVTWTRANIEYKYDMSADLLCINNEGLEEVLSSDKMVALMEMFIPEKKAKKGEPLIKFTAEDYLELYNTLRDLGFVVPCKGCFDAAGRFKMLPSVAQKFAAEVNAVIDERNKDPKAFDEKLKAKAGEETTIEGLPTTASTKSAAIAVGVAGDNLTEHVKWTQLMSADGQTKMLSDWGGIFRAWQRTGAGRPKDKLLPEPYYGDIVSSVSTIIGKYGEKTPSFRDTLVNQGTGLRRNSHSEFRPVLAIDEIQFMRDAFIRNLTVFKYMKELDDVRLFGKMGVKFNMSFFPEYVPGTKVAGLDKEGNYIASEESVGSREFPYQGEDGKRHYDGMKGWAEAQKYINKDVSLSSVIFSIPHLLKALTDVPTPSDMRGIWGSLIPFHSSGATTASLAMQGLGMARANGVGHGFIEAFTDYGKGVTNFEAVQNDRFGEGWYIVSGKKAGTDVEPGHKLEFANGNHYYNRALGVHLFASGYILDSELPEGVLGEKGELNITDEQKKALLHKFTIDYNDKVRDIKGPYAYKAAADYYIAELPKLGLIPRFDFEVSEEKFLEMCEAANVDPRHPKLGWKGEGNSWSPIDSEAYYSLFCDYGMTDPATGEWAPHMPVGYVNEKGEKEFRLPENVVEIVKDGLERFSEVRRSENARIDEAIEAFAERSVEKGRISQKDVDKILGKKATPKKASKSKSEGPIDLVEEARKAQTKHDAKEKKGKKSDVSFRITPEQDKAYMDAVEAGDMETAQRMVDEAAANAGYTQKAYRVDSYYGDKNRYNSVFGGVYYAESLDYYNFSATGHDKRFAKPFFIKTDRFFDPMRTLNLDANSWSDILGRKSDFDKFGIHDEAYEDRGTYDDGDEVAQTSTDGLAYAAQRLGYKGVILRDIPQYYSGSYTEYAIYDSDAVKSAEPVTYDNDGNVIPLSQRFNPENEDIRFRVRTEEEREKLFADAKEEFGTTNNFNVAGYMLPDGSLLDYAEEEEPTIRAIDHRAIGRVINDREYESRYEYVTDFVNEGAIRMLPEYAGFQLSQAPTAEQRSKLMDYIYKFNGEVILEITDENGSPKVYMEYNKRTSPSRIFNDMDGYFNDGTIPGIPPIRFRVTEEQRDEVQFRVISDALYEEMDDMIESLVGASFFRRVEGEFDLGKKVKNFAEFADLITIIKNNDNYISTGSSLLGFFSNHTDQHFPLLLSVDDKALRKQAEAELKDALSQIDDTYILFYIKEAWKAHKNGLAQAGLGVKPNATTKFNKAIDARIEEIRAGRVKGTSFDFKKQEVSLDEIDTLFKQLNTNEELAVLHDKVMDLAKRFGIKPQFAAIRGAAEGESLGDKVRYDYRAFNSPAISDERKANIITHELIHSVTSYAFYLDDYMPNALTPEMREAINILREVYYAIRRDSSFKDEYGASSVEEMVAELSNTAFREKLKEKSLYQRILDAILKLFGVVKEDSAYNAANEALAYIIENYDENAFNLYARQAARSQEYSKWYNSEDVRFRMSNENQAIFVSNAARAVEGIKQEKATPEQWLKMLEKTGGLKAGEDKWMGLSDWLKASDKKTLTKQEVLDYIKENMIIIEEQHYSNKGVREEADRILNENYPGWEDAFSFDWDPFMEEPHSDIYDEVKAARLYNETHEDQVETDEDGDIINDADYDKVEDFGVELAGIWYGRGKENTVREINGIREDYTTSGLTNLHEIALTVPTIKPWNLHDETHFGDAGGGRAVAWIRFGDTQITEEGSLMEYEPKSDVEREIKNYIEYAMRNGDDFETSVGYAYNQITDAPQESAGWTEEAVTAVADGMRGKEKVRKVLVIDEVQSKRHQEGREKGYIDQARLDEIERRKAEIDRQLKTIAPAVLAGDRAAKRHENLLYKEIGELRSEGYALTKDRVPDAPFDKNWHELAMKRMLRYAAENGYDVVAWTTGDQQADRYDLSRDVKKINASKPTKDGERIVNIYYRDEYNDFKNLVVDKEGKVVQGDYSGNALADVIGKEMALQIMNAEESTEFKGEGLKIGGEGMRGFYDKMLPAFMNKYGKKWGVKVEDIDLPNLGKSGRTMHSIPVTEEMKSSVMEGQVMFRTTTITPEVQEEMDAIHASAIVMGNFMKAPNGQPTNLTEEQWLMVRTKGFKEWFGDWINDPENASKVVDKNGEPKVVFHGGAWRPLLEEKGNAVFKMRGGLMGKGAYFTDTLSTAIDYAREKYGWEHDEEVSDEFLDDNGYVTEVFLNIRNEDNIREYYGETFYLATSPNQIKSATDNTGEFSEGEGDIRFKVVTDPSKIEELESGPKIKVYRAMQLIDGKLYPPMSAKVDGQLRQPIELGQWEEAEERPDLADDKGYFKLDKGNKKSLKARYNPYFHTSPTPLNDQFSSAQSRPELVTVEVEIPASELTSGYKAEKAKDGVGKMEWKAGVVQSKLSGTRTVILSRWDKPIRIVPDSEVADEIVKMFEGKDIVMPSNVVTPSLRAELEKRGVPFAETDNKGKPISEFGPIYEQFRGKPKEAVEFLMEKKTGEAVGALNHKDIGDISIVYGNEKAGLKKIAVKHPEVLDILQDILDDATIVQQSENRIKLESGRYFAVISKDYLGKPRAPWLLTSFEKKNSVPDNTMDTGETSKGSKQNDTATLQDTVSESKDSDNIDTSNELDENTSFRVTGTPTEDVVAEGVSLSPAQLASLAGNIFTALPEESRKKITDGLNGNILGLQEAILQIPTSLATKENWNDEDRQMAEVIAEQMTKAVGIEMTRPFSASEALWTLYNAVNKSTDLVSEASRALVRRNLGFDSQTLEMEKEARDGVRFRTVGNASANAQASMYNRGAANVRTRLKESFFDMYASAEELVKAIEKRSGKVAEGFENILMALNQQSSRGLAAMEEYERKFLNKMFDEIRDIMNKTDFKYEDIVRYVILKHGLERNIKLAQRDAMAHYQEIYDDIIAKIKGMNPAQKRTYLTNAQLRDADAKAELAVLQGVNTSALTPDQLRDHKKELAKAKKEAAEAAEHLVRAQKIATMTEQDAQDELDKIFDNINNESDSVYKEMRKNDYSGISSMFYDTLGVDRKNYATEEEYQAALMQAKADKYDTLGDIEGAAQMEVTLFENAVNTDNLWKSINKATKETLRQQYEANMISKDQYENLRNMFEFYVPLRGFADNTAEDMYTYYRRPNSTGYTKPILGAEGRKTEAESPFGWIAAMAGSAIASNVKNEAKLALYYFVANRPDNGIATLSKTWFVHTPGDVDANGKKIFRPAYPPFNQDLSTDAAKQAYEDWQEQMRDLQKQGLAYEAGQRLNLGNSVVNISDTNKPEHIVNVKVGGKDYTIVINGNPRAAQAINGDLNIESSAQDYSTVFGPMLRWMSSVNTSYNPEFWITNMMRDMAFTMMAVNIKEDPAYRRKFKKNYAKAFKVISMVAKNENGTLGNSYIERMYKDFVKYGGVTGYTQIKDSETWEKEIENYLTSNDPASIRNGKAMRGVKSVFHAAHRFGESLEQVSRFAAFLTAVETGKSINEAINDAKEITVNFNRKGSGKMITLEEAKYLTDKNGQPLNKLEQWAVVGISSIAPLGRRMIMFFNAAIQGLNATYQLWKKNKLRSIGWISGYVAVGALNAVLHAMLDDDDDYLDIPQYERRNSLMIGGNGAYFKWALPQEARAFYALGDLAVESVMGRNPHQNVIGEALKISTEILPINPSEGWKAFMPSVAIPFVELALNEDYKGAPIYNEQKWLTEEERKRSTKWSKAYSGTGGLYIGIAKVLNAVTGGDEHDAGLINLQPEKMEHLVQSAFGGTIRTADKFINTIMAAFDPEEDVTVRQFPFLNRILTINDERYKNVHVNDVYDYYAAEAEHAQTLLKQYTKDRDADALKDLKSSDEYKWATIYSKYKKPIKKYQEAIRAADTTNERMELMKQQDELKRKMIKEISDL